MRFKLILIIGLIYISHCLCIEPLSTTVYLGGSFALASIYTASNFIKCVVYECCNQQFEPITAKNWIKYDDESFGYLKKELTTKLHGQPIVSSLVLKAIVTHMKDDNPHKPLVFSFHGWTGGGKNFVSALIANNLYKKGLKSQYVHLISAAERFIDPSKKNEYKVDLQNMVKKELSQCGRQLFIFDEVDKAPDGVLDALLPLLEYSSIPKEQNKAIYILLSNTGGSEITRITYEFYKKGKDRNDITMKDIEPLIDLHAFNEEGGLRRSSIIDKNLVDFFVPFLPLERRHVRHCVRDYLKEKYNTTKNDEFVIKVADELEYFPPDTKLYSKSGCKKVARKVDLMMD